MYRFGVVGNCQISALISHRGAIEWLCLPQPDSPPVFGKLLDPDGGTFEIVSVSGDVKQHQSYVANTNILETKTVETNGTAFKITDFCPRFEQYGRMYRPPVILRIVSPLEGSPAIVVRCKPVDGWSKTPLRVTQGNSHLRFDGLQSADGQLRLTTNMPMTYLLQETAFQLQEPLYFALTYGPPLEEDLKTVTENFLAKTLSYWRIWVKHCSIPPHYQDEVIRSALALKLHCFEDTGAILASLTSSLPEELGGIRNWDYRLCWLRDAAFSLSAFHKLGHFEEMEGFLRFLLNVAHQSIEERLHPVYRLDSSIPLPELSHDNWAGYENSKPVRSGNEAATHVQNDVYGEMVLSLGPLFFDERFRHMRNKHHEDLLSHLTDHCIRSLGVADAGVWEFRNKWHVHSFSTLLCWAGIERVTRLAKSGLCNYDINKLLAAKEKAESLIREATVDGSLRNSSDDPSFDASLSLLSILRFPDQEMVQKTLDRLLDSLSVKEENKHPGFFYRYLKKDDFGKPKSAFLACSFWMAHAFAATGNKKVATAIFERTFEAKNELSLYAEHYDPINHLQLGNFPQAYSHVGVINTAFAVAPSWDDVL